MTLDKQVLAKLAFEPGDKRKLDEIWLTVEKSIEAWAARARNPSVDPPERLHVEAVAHAAFRQAYLDHGIKGPLATTALAAVGL